ncbi:hypothetical protein LTR85_001798 [Meristemomyces frigidus]|nr:hypothetical protein LTR85_001798 [Meristemomyces frigidus]
MPMDNILSQSGRNDFRTQALTWAYQVCQLEDNRGLLQHAAEADITPQLTRTEVHHDSLPHISTSVGTTSGRGDQPLKVWLLWPSTEISRLESYYGNTRSAIEHMDHDCFLIQMPGECIAVPANSPHAVVALSSCYTYGHTFTLQTEAIDPSGALAEKGGNFSATEACEKRVDQLERGLRSKIFRQAYIDHFFETWATDALVFRESHCEHSFQRLVQL